MVVGEVLLHHPRDLPQPGHHEGHPGERWGKASAQAAFLSQDHGTQAEQGWYGENTQHIVDLFI